MSATDGTNQPAEPDAAAGGGAAEEPSEDELRERLEEEVRNLRVQDVLLQSVVSIINLSARRIGKEDEQDLEQARVGIEAARAVVDLLDEEPAEQVRNAISEVQVMYAGASGAAGGSPRPAAPTPEPSTPASGDTGEAAESGPDPRKPPPGLWTPPGV